MIKPLLTGMAFVVGLFGIAGVVSADDVVLPTGPEIQFECRLASAHTFAQAPGEEMMMQREGRRRMHQETMQQRKHLEQLRILKMLELLDLSQEQEVPFLTAFNAMRERQRDLDTRTDQMLDSLAQVISDSAASGGRINTLIERVKALETERHGNMMTFVEQMRGLLTPQQMGKFIIFQKRFEAELLEQVGRFRRGMGHGTPEGEG